MKLLLITAVAFYYVVCQAEGEAWNEPLALHGGRQGSEYNRKENALKKKPGLNDKYDKKKSYRGISKTIMATIRESIEGIISALDHIKETIDGFGWASLSKLIKSFINGFKTFLDDLKSDGLRADGMLRGSLRSSATTGD